MELHLTELLSRIPLPKIHSSHKLLLLLLLTLVSIILKIVPLYNSPLLVTHQSSSSSSSLPPPPSPPPPPSTLHSPPPIPTPTASSSSIVKPTPSFSKGKNSKATRSARKCDITKGEWVRDPEAPYYTNSTCWTIQEHQNCMKYGRPDMDFLKWRWKPDGCELPRFDPTRFLGLLRGKSLAFVGDSLARNQMQSLMCLLSKVHYPKDISDKKEENFKRMLYANYNFTISIFWSPFLVHAEEAKAAVSTLWNLHLDKPDKRWSNGIDHFDYIVISGGNWFNRPSMLHKRNKLVGCLYCESASTAHLSVGYSHRAAFRTALRTINGRAGFRGTTILRTLSPSHFEGGEWDKGGDCRRTRPMGRRDGRVKGEEGRLYRAQLEELRRAAKEGRKKGKEFRLLDATGAMTMRPDGHPSKYGHWAEEVVALRNDCVHWCLPGPVDTWNEFLLHLLISE